MEKATKERKDVIVRVFHPESSFEKTFEKAKVSQITEWLEKLRDALPKTDKIVSIKERVVFDKYKVVKTNNTNSRQIWGLTVHILIK